MAVPRVLHLDRFCGICFKMTLCITTVPTLTMCADDHQLYAADETHRTVESGLKTQGHLALSLLANPEKFQSLTVNARNIKAENDDKTLNIDRIMTSEKQTKIWPFRGFFIVLMILWWISPSHKILPFLMGVNWGQLQINGN